MKRILLASAMFSVCAYNAMADDCCADDGHNDLTGFLLSLGGVLDIDKYDADFHTAAKYENLDGMKAIVAKAATASEGDYTNVKAYMENWTEKGNPTAAVGSAITDESTLSHSVEPKNVYANRIIKVKKNKTVAGGEIKGSAFYNVENGLVVGFDLGLAFTAKGKKRVDINTKFAAAPTDGQLYVIVTGKDKEIVTKVTADDKANGLKTWTAHDAPPVVNTDVIVYYGATSTGLASAEGNEGALISGGADYAAIVDPGVDGKVGSLEFEKDPFSPTAAFLVGGYFKGFFGALRLGVNYMTGKVKGLQNAENNAMAYADGSNINLDHKIRQVSPVLGVQFMKHIKKGVFVYATYDHMFGARKSYLVNSPVKNFKRRQHRISLGLAYHIAQ